MIVLLKSQSLRISVRTVHVSSRVLQPLNASDGSAKVTKKRFNELPTGRVLPDGSIAAPCAPWPGGLEEPQIIREGIHQVGPMAEKPRRRQLAKASTAACRLSQTFEAFDKAGNQRVANFKSADHESPIAQQAENQFDSGTFNPSPLQGEIMKPKRRRKTKAATVGLADQSPPSQPRNHLATEVLQNLAKFPHCILLTRVGQFYESYFDQAAEVSRLLGIKLTNRTWDSHRILMCGFPTMHLDKHLKILVQQNKRFVAMCEEFPRDPAPGTKGGFDRRVVRVITPGTLIDEPFLNPYENNYLLAISYSENHSRPGVTKKTVGLAWIDVSTGEFFARATPEDGLRDELARIAPREIVLDKILQGDTSHPVHQTLLEEGSFVSFITPSETTVSPRALAVRGDIDDLMGPDHSPAAIPLPLFTPDELSAVDLLTTFLHANLLEHMPELSSPNRESTDARMQIDAHTIKALEIREGMREGGTTGSLLSAVKRTITRGGTRLLARWLCSPSTSVREINARQSLVAFLYDRPHLKADLLQTFGKIEDACRIAQKFIVGRGDVSDLSAISVTISAWSSLKKRIALEREMEQRERGIVEDEWASLDGLMSRMCDLGDLVERINMALRSIPNGDAIQTDEDNAEAVSELGSSQTDLKYESRYKWTIKPEFSGHLMALHASLEGLLDKRNGLERELQRLYDAPSLTLRSSPGYGMHVHIARAKRDQAKLKASSLFAGIAESGSTSSFFYQEWSRLGTQILEATMAISTAEKEAFEILRSEVNAHSGHIRRNARIIDELDVTLAFANLAAEMNFVRPVVHDGIAYSVVDGRHPTVESGLLKAGRVFTPNSVSFTSDSLLHVITGPNMAGKSTYLRQTALIAILAQTGSFVPADQAVVGIVDRLFSRVGAKDDLFKDRSTFMVEMLETAEILRHATPRSLVVMDEVGRGTTTKDGLALAFATVHHLVTVNCCRALFATHFHELSDMLGFSSDHKGQGVFEAISFSCTDVDETDDGRFAYAYRLRPGVNRKSHGLKVAQLAGMPPSTLAVAKDTLRWLNLSNPDEMKDVKELTAIGQLLAKSRIQ